MKTLIRFAVALYLSLAGVHAADWPQDAGNAQRTGWTAEEPELPWEFARSPALGLTPAAPIRTEKRPPVVRHLRSENPGDSAHWHTGGLQLMDGGFLPGSGWSVYTGTLDLPTPQRQAYSEGILPRYTFVAAGHIFVEGNGGDLFVLRHAGK